MAHHTVEVAEADVVSRVVEIQKMLIAEDEHAARLGADANKAIIDVMAMYVLAITHGDAFDKATHAGVMDMAGQIAKRLLMTEATEKLLRAKETSTIPGIRKKPEGGPH